MDGEQPPTFALHLDGARLLCRCGGSGGSSIVVARTGAAPTCTDACGNARELDDCFFFVLLGDGRLGIEPLARVNKPSLLGTGEIAVRGKSSPWPASLQRRLCDAADAAGVPLGDKAGARFLTELWTADMADAFGGPPSGRTLRNWRAERLRREEETARPSASVSPFSNPAPTIRRLLAKHVVRCVQEQLAIVEGLSGLHAEIAAVNSGQHPSIPQPRGRCPYPSRRTFAGRVATMKKRLRTGSRRHRSWVRRRSRGIAGARRHQRVRSADGPSRRIRPPQTGSRSKARCSHRVRGENDSRKQGGRQ